MIGPFQLEFDFQNNKNMSTTVSQTINSYSPSINTTSTSTGVYPYTFTNNSSNVLTTTGSGSLSWGNPHSSGINVEHGDVNIKDGELIIKGRKLSETLEQLDSRLAILRPNKDLEERWDELKELRNRYVELEKELLDKEKMWDTLKK